MENINQENLKLIISTLDTLNLRLQEKAEGHKESYNKWRKDTQNRRKNLGIKDWKILPTPFVKIDYQSQCKPLYIYWVIWPGHRTYVQIKDSNKNPFPVEIKGTKLGKTRQLTKYLCDSDKKDILDVDSYFQEIRDKANDIVQVRKLVNKLLKKMEDFH